MCEVALSPVLAGIMVFAYHSGEGIGVRVQVLIIVS